MEQELKSGIPEFDNIVEQYENGKINFLELTCRLWNTAYSIGKIDQLNLQHVSNCYNRTDMEYAYNADKDWQSFDKFI